MLNPSPNGCVRSTFKEPELGLKKEVLVCKWQVSQLYGIPNLKNVNKEVKAQKNIHQGDEFFNNLLQHTRVDNLVRVLAV